MEETVFKRSPEAQKAKEGKLALKFRDRSIYIPKKFLIGRDDDCNISLPHDPLVSRRHAMIEFSQGEYCIRDLSSTNGTWVNSRPVGKGERVPIEEGDVILVGKTTITVSAYVP